jgi:cytochrome c553
MKLRLLAAALLVAAPAAHAGLASLQSKIAQCQGCHGIPDWKTAFPEVYRVPKLGGQKAAYIVSALKAYKAGDRDFPTMRAIAADLTDKDMEDLAAYYSGGPAAAAAPAEKK